MRLTLRTMLAYTDGILEPEDAEDIGKKIDESEYATGLLHRTRDVMRRLRLAAPSLTDRRSELDPNTVAEYLDNTLHDGRVPDFEKVCLESDVHLAEVASCHQILTLVLGEPAEIDPASRQRMYQLPKLGAAEAETDESLEAIESSSGDGQSTHQPPPPKPREKPVVPDYLRDPPRKRRLLPAAVAVAVTGCFVVMILIALGQFEPETPLGGVLARLGLGPEQVAETTDSEASKPKPPPAEPLQIEPRQPAEQNVPAEDDPLPQEVGDSDDPAEDREGGAPAADSVMPDEPDPTPGVPADQETEADPPLETAPMPPGNAPVPLDDLPMPPDDSANSPVDPATLPIEGPPPPADDPEALEAPVPPQRMGRFMSDHEVLLRFDSASAAWHRVPAKGILYPSHRLVSLPTYRPEVTLSAGINLQLLGRTEIELLPSDEQGIAGLKIRYGRTLIMPLIEAGTRLRLVIGDRAGVVTFTDAESIVAVEVVPVALAGTNPEANSGLVKTHLYATKTGHVLWQEGDAEAAIRVEADTCLILDAEPTGAGAAAVAAVPKWTRADALGSWDGLASPVLEQSLDVDRPAGLGLLELTEHRRREVRWLAARCLGCIGQFDPMLSVLNDPDRRQLWPECVEQLGRAVWLDAEVAAEVRRAMARQIVQDAEELEGLYRILWGYTEQELRDGHAEKLIDNLEHKTLAFRVLSFWTLKDLTAWRLSYAPEESEPRRQQRARAWRQRLESGEIWTKLAEERQKKAGGSSRPQPGPPKELR